MHFPVGHWYPLCPALGTFIIPPSWSAQVHPDAHTNPALLSAKNVQGLQREGFYQR